MKKRKLAIAVLTTVVIAAIVVPIPAVLSKGSSSSQLFTVLSEFARLEEFYPFGKRGPMPVVYAAGEPYEMGYQIGAQLKVVFPHKDLLKWVADGFCWTPFKEDYGITDRNLIINKYMLSLWNEVIVREYGSEIANDYWEEMEGLADGYANPSVDFWDIMGINLGWTLTYGEPPYVTWIDNGESASSGSPGGEIREKKEGCSAFAAWGKATENGKMICAQNDDGWWYPWYYMYVLIAAPSKGHAFAGACIAGALGYRPMMNDAGVYIASNAVEPSKYAETPEKYGLPIPSLEIRYRIQYADSAKDAVNMCIKQAYHTDSLLGNIMCVDEKEAYVITMATGGGYVIWQPLDDFIIMVNHCVPDVWADGKPTEEWLTYRAGPGSSSICRYQSILRSLTMNYGSIDLYVARDTQSSHYNVLTGEDPCIDPARTVCRHHKQDLLSETAKCTIGIPYRRELYMSYGAPCISVWVKAKIGTKQQIAQAAQNTMRQLGYEGIFGVYASSFEIWLLEAERLISPRSE